MLRHARLPTSLLALVAALPLAACGSSQRSSRSVAAAQPPAALAASAVPYLASVTHPLTAAGLARESQSPELAGKLVAWNFETGSQRAFQGSSKKLQVVDSRTLRFRTTSGAAAFVQYMRTHAGSFIGGAGPAKPFSSRGRKGIVVEGIPCACHLATPVYLAIASKGPLVSWLEINGSGATPAVLSKLAAKAP